MNTIVTPPVAPLSSSKKVVKQSHDHGQEMPVAVMPAHPLFPPDQAFLWLPGLPGDQVAYCTHNESCGTPASLDDRRKLRRPKRDANRALHAPPYRVSTATFIAWHTNVTPPFPFHPVPISRTLGAAELAEVGRRVQGLANHHTDPLCDPLQILRNDCKCFVLAVLAEMGLLAGRVPQPC